MAQQKPASDPVSQAMLAIEDALNLGLEPGAAPPPVKPTDAPDAPSAPLEDKAEVLAAPEPEPAKSEPVAEAPPPPAALKPPSPQKLGASGPSRPRRDEKPARGNEANDARVLAKEQAANDDRAAAGPIVQALQIKRPSAMPFLLAAVASLVWCGLCGYYGYQRRPEYISNTALILRPETVLFALCALAPIIIMFGFAALTRRLQELRQSAASIAHVAVRLAEPEAVAGEQFSTLAQAIRREVSTMGDGVERAFKRASELELLVREEIAALERSSGEHERRLRTLIAELADQRELIVANGASVRTALGEAHQNAARDLESIGQRIALQIGDIGQAAGATFGASSEQFANTVERASAAGVERMGGAAEEIAHKVTTASELSAAQLIESAERLESALRERGESSRWRHRQNSAGCRSQPERIPPSGLPLRSAARASGSSFSWRPPRTPPTKPLPPPA